MVETSQPSCSSAHLFPEELHLQYVRPGASWSYECTKGPQKAHRQYMLRKNYAWITELFFPIINLDFNSIFYEPFGIPLYVAIEFLDL